MILLKPAIGLFSWCAYSYLQRKYLQKNGFAIMQILSEMRQQPLGNASNILIIASKMKKAKNDNILKDWKFLTGDDDDESIVHCNHTETRISRDIACCYTNDGTKSALYGKNSILRNYTLRELISTKTKQIENVEDVIERINWSEKINECKLLADTKVNHKLIQGDYTYCYRDYVNFEELLGMVSKRGGIERFLYHPTQAGQLHIDSATCTFTEKPKLLSFIPVSIQWIGNIVNNDKIIWNTSRMNIGWGGNKYFSKEIDRPATSERLRKANWFIKVPENEMDGDIICFYREGEGHLVFGKESCLAKKSRRFGLFNGNKNK